MFLISFLTFLNFFFLTDCSNYCEERKIKLLINVYIKISRNLGGNFSNLGSKFLAFQWATFHHFTTTTGKGLIPGDTPYNGIYGGRKKGYFFQALDRWKGRDFTTWKAGSSSAIVVATNSEKSGFHMIAMICDSWTFFSQRSQQSERA